MLNIAICIIAIPFVALVVHTFLSARMPRRGDWFATGAVFLSLGLACWLFVRMLFSPTPIYINFHIDWLNLGTRIIPAGILLDHLTIVMLVVVTLVSALVYLFSIGYMHGDVRYGRYFSYLLLFTTSMLGLVLANNLLVLYIFWELVGLSSYLLIGHWFERDTAAKAALKAFIVTRIGDIGMLFGILLIYFHLGHSIMRQFSRQWRTEHSLERYECSRAWVSFWVPWANPHNFRSMSGCRMPWKARRPSVP